MSKNEAIGGVEFKDVIAFQTQIMMGAQFKRVKKAKDCNDIITACLRMGWNDAFRHTSENVKIGDKTNLDIQSIAWNKNKEHKEEYDDYICSILDQETVRAVFYDYAKAETTQKKIDVVVNSFEDLKKSFEHIKKLEGNKKLCFGHFQKMFNIALKLYLCLYMCRSYLGIDSTLFCCEIIDNLQNADCPVDSIILDCLKKETSNAKYSNYKWSKFGTEEHCVDEYREVQEEISRLERVIGKSNLYYDFIAWEK